MHPVQEIYKEAIALIERGPWSFACTAINEAACRPDLHEHYKEAMRFFLNYKPADVDDSAGLRPWWHDESPLRIAALKQAIQDYKP